MKNVFNVIGIVVLVLGLIGLWADKPHAPETLLMTGMSILYVVGTIKEEKDDPYKGDTW